MMNCNDMKYYIPKRSNSLLIVLMISLILCSPISRAQDIHFTQFYQSPFNVNPALCGSFDGDYRFTAIQRTQWRSVTIPYNTLGFSVDARELLTKINTSEKQNIPFRKTHFGFSYYGDKAGDSKYKSDIFNLVIAQDIFTGNGSGRITPGISIGLTHMKIDYTGLNYDTQWTGFVYDPGISSGEQFARSSRAYMNINAGINYFQKISTVATLETGISLFNLSNPKQSFFDDGYVKLDLRSNFYLRYRHKFNTAWALEPMMLWMRQGTYNELSLGGIAHYAMSNTAWNKFSLYAGILGRAKDAGNIIAGVVYNEWNVGLSYDINTSNLKPASNGRGGFEISVVYIIPTKKKINAIKFCPDYM